MHLSRFVCLSVRSATSTLICFCIGISFHLIHRLSAPLFPRSSSRFAFVEVRSVIHHSAVRYFLHCFLLLAFSLYFPSSSAFLTSLFRLPVLSIFQWLILSYHIFRLCLHQLLAIYPMPEGSALHLPSSLLPTLLPDYVLSLRCHGDASVSGVAGLWSYTDGNVCLSLQHHSQVPTYPRRLHKNNSDYSRYTRVALQLYVTYSFYPRGTSVIYYVFILSLARSMKRLRLINQLAV